MKPRTGRAYFRDAAAVRRVDALELKRREAPKPRAPRPSPAAAALFQLLRLRR